MKIEEIRQQYPMYSDLSDRELVKGLHTVHYSDMPYAEFLRKIDFSERVDPTKDMGQLDRFSAGMGKAFHDVYQGAQQLVGKGPNAEQVRDQKALEAPLMNTGAGVTGNIAGNVAAIAPAALIPGAAAIPAAGALGATAAALQPTETPQERLRNMATGVAAGAGMQFAGTTGAQMLGTRQGRIAAEEAANASRNSVRNETLKAGQEAGYVLPPSAVNPSWINKRLESVAGKAAVGQEAAVRNQEITDALARRAAGVHPNDPLSESLLSASRKNAAEPYRQVASTNQQSADALEAWKSANQEAKLQWNFYNRSGNPEAYKAAQAAQAQADGALNTIEQQAQQTGNPQLVEALKAARVKIAKVHNVENAVNVGTGSVDASALGRALDRGAPLSGELKTIGSFQQAFPSYTREASRVPTPGVSKSEALASALLATAGHAATGGASGLLAGGLPFLSGPARSLVLSKPYQGLMARPSNEAAFLTGGDFARPSTPALPTGNPAILARMLAAQTTAQQR
jgi:hypothetical protein